MEQLGTVKNSGAGIRQLTLAALMVALSAVGAFIKIPGPLGSIAMDSCPGYLYASLCGPLGGSAVAFFGHLASAFTVGFPLGVPIHLVVGAEMGLCAAVYGWIGRRFEAVGGIGTTGEVSARTTDDEVNTTSGSEVEARSGSGAAAIGENGCISGSTTGRTSGCTNGRAGTMTCRSSRPWLSAGLVAVVLNGAGAPLALSPWLGVAAVVPLILPLTVASLMNVALAILVRRVLNSKRVPDSSR